MQRKLLPKTIRLAGMLLVWLLLTSQLAMAQTNVVSGVVKDPQGQAMPGINVIIKGTTNGATTDSDGKFSLPANPSDVLILSFIGYKTQELQVANNTNFNVSMVEDISTLNEIVVSTGYGDMKKSDLTSAQTSVTSKDIDRTVNTTFEQALQGRSAGVYITQNTGAPGGAISINIRGINSINGTNEPLYVIDGIQISGQSVGYGSSSSSNPLAGINPGDIESFDILQGPSATAMYGSRGTNGVVIITTKRGKSGEPKITYTLQHSIQSTPRHIPVMNLPQYAQMVKDVHAVLGGTTQPEFLDPSLLGQGTDWQKALFVNAAMNKHQLSLSGGSDKVTYYMSGEYLKQDGVAIGSGFNRYSFRTNVDAKPREWLTLGANLAFTQNNTKLTAGQENVITNALQLTPQVPVKNLDGSWGGADATNGANVFAPVNPVAIANLTTNTQTNRQFLGGINIGVNIMKGLTFRTYANTNLQFGNSIYYIPTYSIGWAKNVSASMTDGSSVYTSWLWNQLIEYNKTIDKHSLNVIISHESQSSYNKSTTASRTGFLTNDIIDIAAGDPKTAANSGGSYDWAMESYLGRINYNYADRYVLQGAARRDGSSNFGANNKWGFFPSVSAAWLISHESFFNVPAVSNLKLRLETGITGNQGGGGIYSPMASGATPWGTGFLPSKYSNPNLKWEQTKTVNIGLNAGLFQNRIQFEFDYFIKNTNNLLMDNPLPWYMGTNGTGSVGSPTVNIGALQNKGFGLTITTVNINTGDFKWESNFNISSFKTVIKQFYSANAYVDRISWWMNNWTQRSAVGQAPWLFRGYVQEGIFKSVSEIEGHALPVDNTGNKLPVDQTNNGVWVGDAKYKDINGDGKIDEKDLTNIGNPWPKAYAGFTNSFSYKGFDLSVLLTGTFGNDIYNYVAWANTNPNNINLSHNLMVHAQDYARPITDANGEAALSNPNTDVARLSYGPNGNYTRNTSQWVESGTYVRIKNISLSYRVPFRWLMKQKAVKGVRLTTSVQNIHTFTKYKGFDPEVGAYVDRNASATTQSIGLDYGRYPLTPIYSFSLGVDF